MLAYRVIPGVLAELVMFATELPPAHRCVFCAARHPLLNRWPGPASTVRRYATTRNLHPRHGVLIAEATSPRGITNGQTGKGTDAAAGTRATGAGPPGACEIATKPGQSACFSVG